MRTEEVYCGPSRRPHASWVTYRIRPFAVLSLAVNCHLCVSDAWSVSLRTWCDLLEAEHSLKKRFGVDRVLGVRERGVPVNLLVEK